MDGHVIITSSQRHHVIIYCMKIQMYGDLDLIIGIKGKFRPKYTIITPPNLTNSFPKQV